MGSAMAEEERIREILDRLEAAHPDARTYLDFETPLQLLVATILAAQCTDEKVNQVTPALFERFPTAQHIAQADRRELEEIVRPTGFYRRKAERTQECCRIIVEQYDGEVPDRADALTSIPGVGRKTANVVLAEAFGRQTIPVDTHVKRVSTRLGLAEGKEPDKIESQLCEIIPKGRWTRASHLFGTHGRRICSARKPDCEGCPVRDMCDYYKKGQRAGGGSLLPGALS